MLPIFVNTLQIRVFLAADLPVKKSIHMLSEFAVFASERLSYFYENSVTR